MAKKKTFGNILDIPLTPYSEIPTNNPYQHDNDIAERERAIFEHYGLERPGLVGQDTGKLIRKMAQELKIPAPFERWSGVHQLTNITPVLLAKDLLYSNSIPTVVEV